MHFDNFLTNMRRALEKLIQRLVPRYLVNNLLVQDKSVHNILSYIVLTLAFLHHTNSKVASRIRLFCSNICICKRENKTIKYPLSNHLLT